MAAAACLSPSHFHRAFRAATGLTPARHVAARRVERARVLPATDMTLAEFAHTCGFGSQAHLTRVFRARTGTTPGACRRDVAG